MKSPELYTSKELKKMVTDTEHHHNDSKYQFLRSYGDRIEEVVNRYIPLQRPDYFIYTIYDLGIFIKTPIGIVLLAKLTYIKNVVVS